MSWHHGDYIELISAAGTMFAAIVAAYAASRSNKSAKESRLQQQETRLYQQELQNFEREKHLLELLKADADRANNNAQQGYPAELSFVQASNLAHSLHSAKVRIMEFVEGKTDASMRRFISYFRQQLTEEVNAYMCEEPPLSIDRDEPTMEQMEAYHSWAECRRFFGFRYCSIEDLSDEED